MACFDCMHQCVRANAGAGVCTACSGDASLTTHYLINYYHFIILFFLFWQRNARHRVTHTAHIHSSLMCKRLNMTFLLPCHRRTTSSLSPRLRARSHTHRERYAHYVPRSDIFLCTFGLPRFFLTFLFFYLFS